MSNRNDVIEFLEDALRGSIILSPSVYVTLHNILDAHQNPGPNNDGSFDEVDFNNLKDVIESIRKLDLGVRRFRDRVPTTRSRDYDQFPTVDFDSKKF